MSDLPIQRETLLRQRRGLQVAVALAALVPIGAGIAGIVDPAGMLGGDSTLGADGDSHWRYLSGLLLALGLAFWTTVPAIERKGRRFRILTMMVMIGGVARLYGLAVGVVPSVPMFGALAMELLVTPALCLWQWRIARRSRG